MVTLYHKVPVVLLFKAIVHLKIKIVIFYSPSSFSNLYEFLSSVEHKIKYFEECWLPFFTNIHYQNIHFWGWPIALKPQYVIIFLLKYPKTTRTVLYILLTCVLTLSQTFQRMYNPEKYPILTSDTDRVLASPANEVIHPRDSGLFSRKHGNPKDTLICSAFY